MTTPQKRDGIIFLKITYYNLASISTPKNSACELFSAGGRAYEI